MQRQTPIQFDVPVDGVFFAESEHAANFEMGSREDDFHKLLYVVRGAVEVRFEKPTKEVPLRGVPGTMMIVPAGERHRLVDLEPSVLLLLGLGRRFVDHYPELSAMWHRLRRSQLSLLMRLRPVVAGPVVGGWRQGILEQAERRRGCEVALRIIAQHIMISADRYHLQMSADSTDERLHILLQVLSENFYRPWSTDEAAKHVALSRRQFTERFRKVTGKSFVAYVNDLRLDHAERLLRSGRHSVTGAAFSSGFEDLSYFYRLFRQRRGVPPKQWMEAQTD
ncbi:helix-turn-helix domain-containing protein [Actomonas aquatica]|uniref:AraC family transcriptional regulator n=1 Tax=Actomonas aquatica TaxID=2866162 RepID=A0ABZ1C2X0_9BACT|nr:AraC family transcriptional regulator [Opitutus sp. WL0086]WRQ86052.1 AraC family transcriptional regulator [Opitutus sp. WL0086]